MPAEAEAPVDPYDHLYFIEITWAGNRTTRMLVSDTQLGQSFAEWESDYRARAGAKPGWFHLGGLTFYSQNIVSIELIEDIVNEEG